MMIRTKKPPTKAFEKIFGVAPSAVGSTETEAKLGREVQLGSRKVWLFRERGEEKQGIRMAIRVAPNPYTRDGMMVGVLKDTGLEIWKHGWAGDEFWEFAFALVKTQEVAP